MRKFLSVFIMFSFLLNQSAWSNSVLQQLYSSELHPNPAMANGSHSAGNQNESNNHARQTSGHNVGRGDGGHQSNRNTNEENSTNENSTNSNSTNENNNSNDKPSDEMLSAFNSDFAINKSTLLPMQQDGQAITCSLIDNENQDVIAILDNLEQAIQTIPECKNDANLDKMVQVQNQMRSSATEVTKLWDDKEHMTENMGAFQGELQNLLMGVNYVGESLNNNSLLNSRCGREMMSTGKALVAFSDLVTSVAPFAMFAAATAKMSVAIPYVIGVVGLSSVIKIVAQLSQKGSLDMSKWEHRQTVLKATCEFSKVATKIRFLKLAQSGQLEKLTESLKKYDNFIILGSEMPKDLQLILKQRKEFYSHLDDIKKDYYDEMKSLVEIKKFAAKNLEDAALCSYGRELNSKYKQKEFPYDILNTLEAVGSFGDSHAETSGKSLLKQFQIISTNLSAGSGNNAKPEKIAECAQATKSLINAIETSLSFISEEMVTHEQEIERKFSENPNYKEWHSKISDLQKDRQVLDRIVKAVESVSRDSSVMSRTELHQRMENLRLVLFGANTFWNMTEPPIYLWLDHTLNLNQRTVSDFENSFNHLKDEINDMQKQRKGNFTDYNHTSIVARYLKIYESTVDYRAKSEKLVFLTPKDYPVDSPQHQAACQKLEEIWLNWAAAMDHLQAVEYFCYNIKSFIDDKTSTKITDICGKNLLSGKEDLHSQIKQTESKLTVNGFKEKALLVSNKMKELACIE